MEVEGYFFCVLERTLRGRCKTEMKEKLNCTWRGKWHTSSSLRREVLWPGWGKEVILAPEVQLMPLDISKGYYHGAILRRDQK